MRIKERKLAEMIDWGPASNQVAISKKSPYDSSPYKISGLMLANHTSIRQPIIQIIKNYEQLRNRAAYLDNYKQTSVFEKNFDEFDNSLEVTQDLMDEYRQSEKSDYINWDDDFEEGGL